MVEPGHSARRERLSQIRQRWQKVVVLAALVGVITGLAVAAFEFLVINVLLAGVFRLPLPLLCAAPFFGLVINFVVLRYVPPTRTSPATSDAYIATFHDRGKRLELRRLLPRYLGGAVTLGLGGAMGLEGPSLYTGAVIGSTFQRRFRNLFSADERNLLLVAGAAAGVAAIFKAPATGVLFSLEVPFQTDLARRSLIPALIAAAAGYVTFVSISGTQPLFLTHGSPAFDFKDIAGAAVIGVLSGALARGFAQSLRWAKQLSQRVNPAVSITLAGALLAAAAVLTNALFDSPLSVGPGYRAIQWAIDPRRAVLDIAVLFVIRAVATVATVGGGGTGGLFIPLVVQGTLLGGVVGSIFGTQSSSLFPIVGLAAFLGAGYRTPLAGIMFVAETTGRASFVVPALVAAAVAELIMGVASVSPYQRRERGLREEMFGETE